MTASDTNAEANRVQRDILGRASAVHGELLRLMLGHELASAALGARRSRG